MSFNFVPQKKHARRRSESEPRRKVRNALTLDMHTDRQPAIDLRTVSDVSTAACVEMSRIIMKRPEIDTGKLFRLIAASSQNVNKSDAVIVVTASILESIGNSSGAKKLLEKSRTVSSFYSSMGLDDEKKRHSFVIMLFALAPEFVKMVESALSTSLNRVKATTTAPHAMSKMFEAHSELLKDGSVSPEEHTTLMDDLVKLEIRSAGASGLDSIQHSPQDGIDVSDSISRVAAGSVVKDNSPLSSRGLMRYVKGDGNNARSSLYSDFPNVARPVDLRSNYKKQGIGYNSALSAYTADISEDNFSSVMNQILPTATKRHRLSMSDKKVFLRAGENRDDRQDSTSTYVTCDDSREPVPDAMQFEVTREDVEKKKASPSYVPEDRSPAITDDISYDTDVDEDAMDLE